MWASDMPGESEDGAGRDGDESVEVEDTNGESFDELDRASSEVRRRGIDLNKSNARSALVD